MQARLKVLHDKANVKQVKLLPVTLIGRSTECNLKIASSQVSRAHCRITLGEDTVYIEDLGSANGTLIDGKRLTAHQPTSVLPGATLVVGPAEFLIDYVASTSATMVLSRLAVPNSPSLSSTELWVPMKDVPAKSEDSSSGAVATPQTTQTAAAASNKPVSVTTSPVAVLPVEAATPTAAVVVGTVRPPTPSVVPSAEVVESQAANSEVDFAGFAASADEPIRDEVTQFMFGESPSPSDDSPTSFTGKSSSGKQTGLKSLFSLFGRKAKGMPESSSSGLASAGIPSAPSVFLPTMDQVEAQASAVDVDAEPTNFSFGDPATVESTAQTVTFEHPLTPEASTPIESPANEDDGGFGEFLKQL